MSEKVVKSVEFRIVTELLDDDRVRVYIQDAYRQNTKEDAPFIFWMTAAEYFLHKTAQKSNAGYERAMELIVKGAMTYKEVKDGEK